MKHLNKKLDNISRVLHKKTGYNLHQVVLACEHGLSDTEYPHDFFKFNSDEWQIFIELLEQACK